VTIAGSDIWQGRDDSADGPAARRWHQIVRLLDAATPAGTVVLHGFACDAGVARNQARVGAAEGPVAIRRALANMPVHECERLADGGDVVCTRDALEEAQSVLANAVTRDLAAARFPIVLGGGHEVAFASFSGLAEHLASASRPPRVGIVNFDAHFDLRDADRGTSGTPFLQIARRCGERGWPFHYACLGISRYANTRALFDRADSLGVSYWLDESIDGPEAQHVRAALGEFIAAVDHVYLTFCLDVLPASAAPGVSAPAPRGVALRHLEPLIDVVLAGGKLRLVDIAEMNPRFDVDRRTALVAARVVARIANGVARGALR
jgi:formiminoglutamase